MAFTKLEFESADSALYFYASAVLVAYFAAALTSTRPASVPSQRLADSDIRATAAWRASAVTTPTLSVNCEGTGAQMPVTSEFNVPTEAFECARGAGTTNAGTRPHWGANVDPSAMAHVEPRAGSTSTLRASDDWMTATAAGLGPNRLRGD